MLVRMISIAVCSLRYVKGEPQTDHKIIGESLLKASGRFPFNEERVAACDTTGRDERDISLEWMEKEERLFKDVEINVSLGLSLPYI